MIIEQKINAVLQAYRSLIQANKNFLAVNREHVESFRSLIDQRAMLIEDIELLTQQMVSESRKLFQGTNFDFSSLVEVVRALPLICPEMAEVCQKLKDTLRELVDSDVSVENALNKLSDEIKAELNKIRKGSHGLKGYRQVETLGSCFINRVK